jgi:hypothetical protein
MSKKIRNRFVALGCLLVFIGLGVLFYVNWVVQKPFAIILFLTDNLTTSTLTAARIYGNGADHRCPHDARVSARRREALQRALPGGQTGQAEVFALDASPPEDSGD